MEDKKKREEIEEEANVYKDFVETFENPQSSAVAKTWVKAGTYDAGTRKEDYKDKGKLYKPTPKHLDDRSTSSAQEYAKILASESKKDSPVAKKKPQDKKKSNLELVKFAVFRSMI